LGESRGSRIKDRKREWRKQEMENRENRDKKMKKMSENHVETCEW